MRIVLGVLAVAVLVQVKPNFSGTWTLVSSPAGTVATKPVVAILTQNDTTLTLKNGDLTMVMPLDGSETTIKSPGPSRRDVKLRTRWDGERLVVEQRTETTSILQTVSLSKDGNELTIETVAQTPQGEGREKQIFKKSG
jgi:hypothetical protein